LFTLPFVAGDPKTALLDPLSLVLTETTARKHIGDQDALGQTLTVSDTLTLRITGILEDLPENTHLQFDFMAPMPTALHILKDLSHHWGATLIHAYLLLADGTDASNFVAKLPAFIATHVSDQYYKRTLNVEALARIHLFSGRPGGLKPPGSIC
jgi:putative ABC transport system permease protein